MESGFFILLRHYLRVDRVLVRLKETRLYHSTTTNHIVREHSTKYCDISNMEVCCSDMEV